jgi:hypothetical protein
LVIAISLLIKIFILISLIISYFQLDPTGNNHDATELQEVVPDSAKEEEEGGGDDESSGFKVKERSILQAKLTRLAIQIGYAGNNQTHINVFSDFHRGIVNN